MKETDLRLGSAGVDGDGEDFERRASEDGVSAVFRVAASLGVPPPWFVEAVVGFECDFLIFLEGLVVGTSGAVVVASVTVSNVCLRFLSLAVTGIELVSRGVGSSLTYLSLRPSFFQAGT